MGKVSRRRSDRPALVFGEAIRKQEAKAGAKGGAGAGDQDQFREGDSRFSHGNTSGWYGCKKPKPTNRNQQANLPA